jgi:hypothetical protein
VSSGFHIGDNFTMSGNHNVGKIVGQETPRTNGSSQVWREPFVFINYRRTDEKAAADIDTELTGQLGVGAVFRDVSMRAGTEFPQELVDRATRSAVMLSIVGEKWDDTHGLRLLHDPDDWVHREIAMALDHGVQVVPILVGARPQLVANDLPHDIRGIAFLQAPHLRRNYDAHDVRRLVDDLSRDIPPLAVATFRGRPPRTGAV